MRKRANGREDHEKVMIMARLDPAVWAKVKQLSSINGQSAAATLRVLLGLGLKASGNA